MYCRCNSGGKHGYKRQRLPGHEDSELWVCGYCSNPTKMVLDKLTNMRAPLDTTAVLSSHGRADGITEVRYATKSGVKTCLYFHPYPFKVDMTPGRDLLLSVWQKLDGAMNALMKAKETGREDHHLTATVECRAYAAVLAEFMPPFFSTVREVSAEAKRRWNARQSGEDYETPGLAEQVWNPTTDWQGNPKTIAAPAKKAGKQLTDVEKTFVKDTLSKGTLTADVMAGMFKVDVDQIEACR